MTIIKREGKGTSRWKRPITSLEEWRDYAGPKDVGAQWWPGFSALECANAWLEVPEQMPSEIITLLGTHAAFGTIATWEAEPEAAALRQTPRPAQHGSSRRSRGRTRSVRPRRRGEGA